METEPLIGMIINAQARKGASSNESALSSYVTESGQQVQPEGEDDESHELTDVYQLVDSKYNVRAPNCIPRPDRNPLMHVAKPKRPDWPIEASIFYTYVTKEEDDSLVKKCFLKDWDDMKKLKFRKGKESEVKSVALQYYRLIKDAYRVQAGLSSAGTVISVPFNQYTVFLQELDLIDNFNFKTADADIMFTAINTF